MDAGAKSELNSIIRELNSIISELEDISSGVRKDFQNIGSEKCADCVDKVLSNYRTVKKKLNNMDTSKVKEGYSGSYGGGGSRSF